MRFKSEIAAAGGVYHLGDEMAFKVERDGKLFFTVGGEVQTDKDLESGEVEVSGNFQRAWKEALDCTHQFDPETLLSERKFFDSVYKTKRDEFAARWTEPSEEKVIKPVKSKRKHSI